MTQNDIEMLAAAFILAYAELHKQRRIDSLYGVSVAAGFVADALAAINPRFDRAEFLCMCGGPLDAHRG